MNKICEEQLKAALATATKNIERPAKFGQQQVEEISREKAI